MMQVVTKIYETALDALQHPENYKRTTGIDAYKHLCTERLKREMDAVEKTMGSVSEKIRVLRIELTEKQCEFTLLARQQLTLSEIKDENSDRYNGEFAALAERSDDITEIAIVDQVIYITTKEITCVDPRSNVEHLLGRYRIMIDFGANLVRMFNLDRTVKSFDPAMQAPHVFSSGRPCWGSLSTMIIDLMLRMDVPVIAQTCIAFLRSVNTDDPAGKYISSWPKLDRQKAANELPPTVNKIRFES
jgi:hypothetical protein